MNHIVVKITKKKDQHFQRYVDIIGNDPAPHRNITEIPSKVTSLAVPLPQETLPICATTVFDMYIKIDQLAASKQNVYTLSCSFHSLRRESDFGLSSLFMLMIFTKCVCDI